MHKLTLTAVSLLLSSSAFAGGPSVTLSGHVSASWTASGGYTPPNSSLIGDNRPCHFFQINKQPQKYAVPMTTLGSNAQIIKIDNAAAEYAKDPSDSNLASVITFDVYDAVSKCGGFPMADRVVIGAIE